MGRKAAAGVLRFGDPRGKTAPTASCVQTSLEAAAPSQVLLEVRSVLLQSQSVLESSTAPTAPAQGSAPAARHQDSCAHGSCRRWNAAACV